MLSSSSHIKNAINFIQNGSTSSVGTGPQSAYEGNRYKYIEVTGRHYNDEARMVSSFYLTCEFYLSITRQNFILKMNKLTSNAEKVSFSLHI